MRRIDWMLAAVVGTIGWTALAGEIALTNASFENPNLPKGTQGYPGAPNWNTPGPVLTEVAPGIFINTNAGIFINDPDKNNDTFTDPDWIDNASGDGTGFDNCAFLAALSGNEFWQPVNGVLTQAGMKYILSADIAHNYGGGNPAFQPDSTAKVTLALFYLDDNNDRQLLASRDVVMGADNLEATHFLNFSAESAILAPGSSVGRSLVVSLLSSSPVDNSGGFFDIDNVQLVAVPEPASFGMLTLATLAVAARRRR